MTIIAKLKKIRLLIREHIPGKSPLRRILLFLDVIWASLFYGGAIDDYFAYHFYLRKYAARKNFIVWRKRRKIINICNKKSDRDIFNLKPRFHKTFAKYLGRDWLDMTQSSLEEFAGFVSRNNSFFVKPVQGAFGKGVRIQRTDEQDDLKLLYARLQGEKVIIEEVIEQHGEIAEFNPASVNTLRIVTLLCADGTVKVMTANFRCGNGEKDADNFHHDGIASTIDIPTGIVVTTGIGRDFTRYTVHPVSGKPIVGFQIPLWDKVLETVTEAAQVVSTVRYVGWDVAIGKDGGIIIVEGNCAAGQDVTQMPDQAGKWPLYKEELRRICSMGLAR